MPVAQSNGIEIQYETIGDAHDEPLLLVMGLGAQLTAWPDEFCGLLSDRGFFVVRFDNRDCGLSTAVATDQVPDLMAVLAGEATPPYRLENMAADTAGLIEALGIEPAHVVGASMGGMIAQSLTIHHPWRVRSLCSIMSTTGDPSVGQPNEKALAALLQPLPSSRPEAIEASVATSRVISSPGFPFDEERVRRQATEAYDRSYRPDGALRQLAAILASTDRTPELHDVTVPTVVIHGADDPLVDPSGGRATADAVPGAELLVVSGMGHDLPSGAWATLVEAIVSNTRRAGARPRSGPT